MKRTRTIASQEDREEVLDRDGPQCLLCGGKGTDFDHAFCLGNNSRLAKVILNRSWNLNLLCRRCHLKVTNPIGREQHAMRLKLMQTALHRAYDEFKEGDYAPYYKMYKEKAVKFNYQFEK